MTRVILTGGRHGSACRCVGLRQADRLALVMSVSPSSSSSSSSSSASSAASCTFSFFFCFVSFQLSSCSSTAFSSASSSASVVGKAKQRDSSSARKRNTLAQGHGHAVPGPLPCALGHGCCPRLAGALHCEERPPNQWPDRPLREKHTSTSTITAATGWHRRQQHLRCPVLELGGCLLYQWWVASSRANTETQRRIC